MPTKNQLINNLREYSVSDIVHAIKCGEISMYELSKSGKLTPLLKKRIEELMASEPAVEISPEQAEENVSARECLTEQTSVSETLIEPTVATPTVATPPAETPPAHVEKPMPPAIHPSVESTKSEPYSKILDNKGMFKRVFSFKGRIRRTEYGLSYIIFFIWYVFFMSVTEINNVNLVLALFIILTIVPAYWFFWAQGAKRCHDRGNSGWYQIIPFYFLVMLFGGSEEGINDYGTNPKE